MSITILSSNKWQRLFDQRNTIVLLTYSKLRWKIFSLGGLPGEKLVILLILSSLGKTVNKSSLPRANVCSVTTAYYSKTKIVHSIEKQQQQKKHFFQEC